ncbi:hypothetical protein HKCCE3408_09620 [Rhodobacterales bacterium HKCCE3408]|nr:hypothetical protein [Rhodobacterales bacterium HKCCE3408]
MLLPLIRTTVLAALLAGCQPASVSTPAATGLSADAGGLKPAGTDLRIDFGRAQAGVVDAVTRLLGAPPVGTTRACDGATGLQWASGLTLLFRDGDFRGWIIDQPGISAGGLSVGGPSGPSPGFSVEEQGGRVIVMRGGLLCRGPEI